MAVLNTALEVGGKHIALWKDLVEGLRDEGCRYLFQVSFLNESRGRDVDEQVH